MVVWAATLRPQTLRKQYMVGSNHQTGTFQLHLTKKDGAWWNIQQTSWHLAFLHISAIILLMEEIFHHLGYKEPNKIMGMTGLSSGAGFLPSTVSLAFPYHLFLNLPTRNMCTKSLAPIEEACPNVQLSAENQRWGWLFWSSNIAGGKSVYLYINLYHIISYILIKHLPEDFGGKWPISDFKWKKTPGSWCFFLRSNLGKSI